MSRRSGNEPKPVKLPAPYPPTVQCKECKEPISVELSRAIDMLYGPYQYRGSDLAEIIEKDLKRNDTPDPANVQEIHTRAVYYIEDWIGFPLSVLIDAVNHFELDRYSIWCERCGSREEESIARFINNEWLCGDCCATESARPQDEERK